MDLNYVKKLVKLLASSEVDEIEVEEEGKRVRVAKHRTNSTGAHAAPSTIELPGVPAAAPDASRPGSTAPSVPSAPEVHPYHEIKSPIVGTFYRAPAPDAAPFVNVGSVVEPGNVLCIVEAMKLMNEIESDVAGKIVKIMVENGHPVEYDQTLFLVDKT